MERQTTDTTLARLSVIVVSDYAAGEEKSWEDLRRALRAWVDQEGGACRRVHARRVIAI
jgi:hypothetical protein